MASNERDYESESGEGSYSSPMHSPSGGHHLHHQMQQQRLSESDSVFSGMGGGDAPGSPTSHHAVPLQKVRQIVATQGEVLPFTPDGIYALAKVSELFVEHLLTDTVELHGVDEEIGYDQLAETIQNDEDLSFLHDFFPTRISLEEAQQRATEKMHEEDD